MVRRIAAIVLPELACELARRSTRSRTTSQGAHDEPQAVIVAEDAFSNDAGLISAPDRNELLAAVDERAWRYGARPGQSVAEAAAFVSRLNIVRLEPRSLRDALGTVADVALGYGTTAALDLRCDARRLATSESTYYPLGAGAGPDDTVWLDVTGMSRLTGGEDLLAAELREKAQSLGHRARVAIANGPRIAQAIARWAPPTREELISRDGRDLQSLPIAALPLSHDNLCWLAKLGILRIDDLAKLDRARLSHRLGPRAHDLLELIAGRDDVPLTKYQPPRRITEEAVFEDEIHDTEPLFFVLRGLTSRAITRLSTRGEACSQALIELSFDASYLALEEMNARMRDPNASIARELRLELELPVPLATQAELQNALHAKLERLTLPGPVVGLRLTLENLTGRNHHQLDLSRSGKATDPNALPSLLAELSAWVGPRRVGVLACRDSHRPEARSALVPVDPTSLQKRARATTAPSQALQSQALADAWMPEPTRVLPAPIPVGRIRPGATISRQANSRAAGSQPFDLSASRDVLGLANIDRLRMTSRIDNAEWWSDSPVCRDYARAWLKSGDDCCEAWIYIDRRNGQGYLHGWLD